MKKTTKFIHVNQHNIRANIHGGSLPVITVKQGSSNRYCDGVRILGESEIIYSGSCEKPLLKCGARVVIRTDAEVVLVNERSRTENTKPNEG